MTREEAKAIHDAYHAKLGEPLRMPSLDYGQIDISEEDFYSAASAAIEQGVPIDWSKHFKSMPPGAVS